MPNAVMVAFTGISDPDREDEFNQWYDEVHAIGTLGAKGVLSCKRYKLSAHQMLPSELPVYLTIYEIDPEALDTLPKELADKFGAGEISMHELMNEGMVAVYAPLSEPKLPGSW